MGQIDVPERREPKDEYHITILNLGKDVPPDQIARAALAAFGVTSNAHPFQVETNLVTCFPGGDDGVPTIAKIESPALHQLWQRLKDAFDSAGVEYSKKYPEYKPHVTLAYAQETTPDKPIPKVSWNVKNIVLWGGDKGANKIVVTLPLGDAGDVAASLRVAARHQRLANGWSELHDVAGTQPVRRLTQDSLDGVDAESVATDTTPSLT